MAVLKAHEETLPLRSATHHLEAIGRAGGAGDDDDDFLFLSCASALSPECRGIEVLKTDAGNVYNRHGSVGGEWCVQICSDSIRRKPPPCAPLACLRRMPRTTSPCDAWHRNAYVGDAPTSQAGCLLACMASSAASSLRFHSGAQWVTLKPTGDLDLDLAVGGLDDARGPREGPGDTCRARLADEVF